MKKSIIIGLLFIAIGLFAEDINRTLRFRTGGKITMDTTASIADEDGNWTINNSTLSTLAAGNISASTNSVTVQGANYTIAATDSFILLSAAHTATLPTAGTIPGKVFTVLCTSSGTNAILTTSNQTINGFSKYTNTAQFKFTSFLSDGTNWWVVNQN